MTAALFCFPIDSTKDTFSHSRHSLVEVPDRLVFQIARLHPLKPRGPLLLIGRHSIPEHDTSAAYGQKKQRNPRK